MKNRYRYKNRMRCEGVATFVAQLDCIVVVGDGIVREVDVTIMCNWLYGII